jgi:hypothetical protein
MVAARIASTPKARTYSWLAFVLATREFKGTIAPDFKCNFCQERIERNCLVFYLSIAPTEINLFDAVNMEHSTIGIA